MVRQKAYCITLLAVFALCRLFAQIKTPDEPQFTGSFNTAGYYFNSTIQASQVNTWVQPNMYGENNAGMIINQTNNQSKQAMGFPTMPIIPFSDPVQRHEQIINEYNSDRRAESTEVLKQKHLLEVLNEVHTESSRYGNSTNKNNTAVAESYQKAYTQVNNMLTGKNNLSFINASYYTETAYGDPYMDYTEYKKNILQSAEFIKKWLKENNAPAVAQNIHFAIQQFMGDTMSVTMTPADSKESKQTITHYPFKYDYEDYDGKTDYRNYFSTKCLATGTGQCNSMPIVYLQLCEALGVKGYLTFAPFHSFIKYQNEKGNVINYEPTSHWTIPDKWYQDNLGVTPQAKAKGIYLDTLNRKQAVANTLVDLAISYMLKAPNPDSAFVMKCLTTAQKYFPKNNNVYIYLAKSSLLSRQLDKALRKHGVKDLGEVKNHADTNNLYNSLMQNENILTELGYQELPQEVYDEMIKYQKNKTNAPNAKVKKSLFKTN